MFLRKALFSRSSPLRLLAAGGFDPLFLVSLFKEPVCCQEFTCQTPKPVSAILANVSLNLKEVNLLLIHYGSSRETLTFSRVRPTPETMRRRGMREPVSLSRE